MESKQDRQDTKPVVVVGPDGALYELPAEVAKKFERAAPGHVPETVAPAPATGLAAPEPAKKSREPESLSLKENLKLIWSFRKFFVPFLVPALGLLLFALVQGDVQLATAHFQQRVLDSLMPGEAAEAAVSAPATEEEPASVVADDVPDFGQPTFLVRLLPTLDSGNTLGLTAWMAGLLLFTLVAAIISEQASVILNQKFRLRVQQALVAALARERKESRSSRQSGVSSSIFSSDAGGLSSLLIFGVLGFFENVVKTIVYCVGLFLLPGGWILLSIMLVLSVVFQVGVLSLFHRKEAETTEQSEKLMIALDGYLIRFFEMLGRFVSFGSDARLARQLREMSWSSAEANRKFQLVSSIRNTVSGLLMMMSLPITVLILIWVAGDEGLSPGLVIQANTLVGLMMGGVAMLIMTPATLTHYGPSLRRVRAILDVPEVGEEPPEFQATLDQPSAPELIIENLEFSFASTGAQILRGIDIRVPAGSTVGIVGPSGCGKSTLASILQGDLKPTGGSIRLHGKDITDWDLKWKRHLIGFMPTAFEFLAASVRDNILLGRTPEEAPNFDLAVERTGVLEFLQAQSPPRDLDYQIESFTGEGFLSSGQRRRIGIAQALAGPQKVLILDEPGANLNPGDMVRIAEALPGALEGRTVLMITHDPDVFRTDKVFFMLDGRIAAVGTHEELMANSEDYRRIVSRNKLERSTTGAVPTPAASTPESPTPPPASGSKEAYRQRAKQKPE